MKLAFSLVICIFLIVACAPGRPIQAGPTATPSSSPTPVPTLLAGSQENGGIPSAWENTQGVPPVMDQGSAGSCYAWAAGYYYLTHLQWRDYGWDVNDPAHQCSRPSFIT